jgi:hypothetical protein
MQYDVVYVTGFIETSVPLIKYFYSFCDSREGLLEKYLVNLAKYKF